MTTVQGQRGETQSPERGERRQAPQHRRPGHAQQDGRGAASGVGRDASQARAQPVTRRIPGMPGGHVEHGDVYEGGDDGDRHEGRGRHEQDGAGGAQPERARHPQPEDARQSGGGQRQRAPEPCAERPEERRATWVSPSSRHSRRAVCRAIPAAYEVMTGSEASSQQRFNTARYAGNSSQRRARVVGRGWVYGGCSGEGVRDRVGVGGRDGDGDGGVLGEGDGEGEREGEGMGVSVGPAARPRPAFTAPHRPAPPPSPGPPRACPAAGVRSGRPGCGRGRCGRRGGRVPRRGRGRW